MPRRKDHPQQTPEERETPPTRPGANGGTLRTGGANAGGPGVLPRTARGQFRQRLERQLQLIDKCCNELDLILSDPKASRTMKLNAMDRVVKQVDVTAKYAGITSITMTDADGNDVPLLPALRVFTAPPDAPAAEAGEGPPDVPEPV